VHTRRYRFRIGVVSLIFILSFICICARIAYLHIFFHKKAVYLANRQHIARIELEPKRGDILDRHMRKLAVSLKVDSVYAVSRHVKEKNNTAKKLSAVLGKSEAFLQERLNRDKMFVWIARRIPEDQSDKIKALDIDGIELIEETKRFYPNLSLACQTIGFAGIDNMGLEGIEAYYNKYMQGKKGYKIIIRDAKGRQIHAFGDTYVPPVNGCSIITTIDEVIQQIAEKALKKAVDKHKAESGAVVVMDPHSGDVLALAVLPSYDLNMFSKASDSQKRNRAITDYYEPGSVFKVITASACVDSGSVSFTDTFYCQKGIWPVAGRILHDHQGHAELSFKEVIEKSSNIGTVKAAMELGEKGLYGYIKNFGFGSATGINLPGEIGGMLRPLNTWTKGSIAAIPMGHEIGVTLIQLTAGVSVIANGGELVRPRIVSGIVDENGQAIREFKPLRIRRVISEDTACQVRGVMRSVIENGTGKRAKLVRFSAGGKTGTSQKIDSSGRYSHRDYIASFAGFAPADKPLLTVCVMVDTPRNEYYGGTVAAPVFKEICDAALRYMIVDNGQQHET